MNTIRNPVDLYAWPLPQARLLGLDRLAVRLTKVTIDRKNILSYCLCGRRESVLVVAGLLLVSVSLALG